MNNMKQILAILVVLLSLTLFSCGNDDESELVLPMFNDYGEFMDFVDSREWMFGIDIDNKDGNTAELYVMRSQVELSMDDEISLTINGEPVGAELIDHEEGVWLNCDSVEIPDNKQFDINFKYNGDTVFDKTISIPDAPSITDVSISTPVEPIHVTWQQNSTPSMYAAEVWLAGGTGYGYIDFLMLSGSARSFTIAANATGLEEINQWSIELHSFNIVQHENNAVLANRHDYKSSQSRFHTWKTDLHNMDNRGLGRLFRSFLR